MDVVVIIIGIHIPVIVVPFKPHLLVLLLLLAAELIIIGIIQAAIVDLLQQLPVILPMPVVAVINIGIVIHVLVEHIILLLQIPLARLL
jgi:hypothetical protein